jgi:threonine aldolase
MSGRLIDLRSDTVTRPTSGMRRAIAEAEVGDDVYGEDPTVNRLEARMCELLGKPAAVFACSGSQSNQMGVWAHCQPGDELLIDETGHIVNYEAGGPAALSGVSARLLRGRGGMIDVGDLEGQIRPSNTHYPITKLVCLENTTNHGGGRVYPLAQGARISDWAHRHQLKLHVDGARLFNACVAGGYRIDQFAALADSVSICFSKGLGCPMGSMLLGEPQFIQRARRARKLFGGGLRQAGMMAAAAIYALDHHVTRLAEDHTNARRFAERIAELPGLTLDLASVESNLVFFEVARDLGTGAEIVTRWRERGILALAMGPQRIRVCTHLDVTASDLDHAAGELRRVLGGEATRVPVAAAAGY